MKKIKHIIWDWNGTLLDDIRLLRRIVNGFLERDNKPPLTDEEHKQLFGFPIVDYYKRMGFDFTKVSYEQICVDFTRDYYSNVGECKLRQGSEEVLEVLSRLGYTQSVLSVSEQARLEQMVDRFGVGRWFTRVIGRGDHSGGTKIDLGKDFVNEANLEPGGTLFIGDTVHDYETASALGTDCVLVESGYQARDRLDACGCPVLGSLTEVLAILGYSKHRDTLLSGRKVY